jgi:hypothetical protein
MPRTTGTASNTAATILGAQTIAESRKRRKSDEKAARAQQLLSIAGLVGKGVNTGFDVYLKSKAADAKKISDDADRVARGDIASGDVEGRMAVAETRGDIASGDVEGRMAVAETGVQGRYDLQQALHDFEGPQRVLDRYSIEKVATTDYDRSVQERIRAETVGARNQALSQLLNNLLGTQSEITGTNIAENTAAMEGMSPTAIKTMQDRNMREGIFRALRNMPGTQSFMPQGGGFQGGFQGGGAPSAVSGPPGQSAIPPLIARPEAEIPPLLQAPQAPQASVPSTTAAPQGYLGRDVVTDQIGEELLSQGLNRMRRLVEGGIGTEGSPAVDAFGLSSLALQSPTQMRNAPPGQAAINALMLSSLGPDKDRAALFSALRRMRSVDSLAGEIDTKELAARLVAANPDNYPQGGQYTARKVSDIIKAIELSRNIHGVDPRLRADLLQNRFRSVSGFNLDSMTEQEMLRIAGGGLYTIPSKTFAPFLRSSGAIPGGRSPIPQESTGRTLWDEIKKEIGNAWSALKPRNINLPIAGHQRFIPPERPPQNPDGR